MALRLEFEAPSFPRRRVRSACSECRLMHKACDRKRPCERCMQLGIGARCIDPWDDVRLATGNKPAASLVYTSGGVEQKIPLSIPFAPPTSAPSNATPMYQPTTPQQPQPLAPRPPTIRPAPSAASSTSTVESSTPKFAMSQQWQTLVGASPLLMGRANPTASAGSAFSQQNPTNQKKQPQPQRTPPFFMTMASPSLPAANRQQNSVPLQMSSLPPQATQPQKPAQRQMSTTTATSPQDPQQQQTPLFLFLSAAAAAAASNSNASSSQTQQPQQLNLAIKKESPTLMPGPISTPIVKLEGSPVQKAKIPQQDTPSHNLGAFQWPDLPLTNPIASAQQNFDQSTTNYAHQMTQEEYCDQSQYFEHQQQSQDSNMYSNFDTTYATQTKQEVQHSDHCFCPPSDSSCHQNVNPSEGIEPTAQTNANFATTTTATTTNTSMHHFTSPWDMDYLCPFGSDCALESPHPLCEYMPPLSPSSPFLLQHSNFCSNSPPPPVAVVPSSATLDKCPTALLKHPPAPEDHAPSFRGSIIGSPRHFSSLITPPAPSPSIFLLSSPSTPITTTQPLLTTRPSPSAASTTSPRSMSSSIHHPTGAAASMFDSAPSSTSTLLSAVTTPGTNYLEDSIFSLIPPPPPAKRQKTSPSSSVEVVGGNATSTSAFSVETNSNEFSMTPGGLSSDMATQSPFSMDLHQQDCVGAVASTLADDEKRMLLETIQSLTQQNSLLAKQVHSLRSANKRQETNISEVLENNKMLQGVLACHDDRIHASALMKVLDFVSSTALCSQNSQIGVSDLTQNKLVYLNSHALDFIGDGALNQLSAAFTFHPCSLETVNYLFESALRCGDPHAVVGDVVSGEIVAQSSQGSYFPGKLNVVVLRTDDGVPKFRVTVFTPQ